MGVYISGMEMPKKAEECRFFGDAMFGRKPYCSVRPGGSCHFPEDCPLAPVPPHGRLIDESWLKETLIETLEAIRKNPKMDMQEMHLIASFATLGEMVANAPTIIEAEGRE